MIYIRKHCTKAVYHGYNRLSLYLNDAGWDCLFAGLALVDLARLDCARPHHLKLRWLEWWLIWRHQMLSDTIRDYPDTIRSYQTLSNVIHQTPSNIIWHYHLDSNHKRKRKLIQSSVLSDFHLPVQFLLLVFINRLLSKKFLHTFVWRFHRLSLSSNQRTRSLDWKMFFSGNINSSEMHRCGEHRRISHLGDHHKERLAKKIFKFDWKIGT